MRARTAMPTPPERHAGCSSKWGDAAEQGDEADEAFGGTNPRAASGARPEAPPHARAGSYRRGHRFAAYPRCSTDYARAHAGRLDGVAGDSGRRTSLAV